MAKDQALTATGILTAAFLALLAGHLLLKYYMPNPAVGGVGFLLVGLIFSYVLFVRRDPFGFILVVYICSHFSYAEAQGGLWNLMTFGILVIYLVVGRRREGLRRSDLTMSILLGILVFWNVLGWTLKNPLPIVPEIQGMAAFLGFILMFHMASHTVITKERFRLFLSVTFFMLLYQFLVALNQRYSLVGWNTPLIGGYSELGGTITSATKGRPTAGTLGHFELFGEYAALLICLLIPLLSSSYTQRELRFGSNRIVVMVLICLAIVMLTSNRAATVLVALTIASYYLVLPMRIFSSIDRFSRQLKIIMAVALFVPVVGVYVGLGDLEEDFSALSSEKFSVESVVSGKSINRGSLISDGLRRLQTESWWVGYGFGIPRSNRWAWFGIDSEKHDVGLADFHSLYLSLPGLYGWIGTLVFVAMILVTAFRAFSTSLRRRNRKSYLMVLAVGFTVFWGVFLANEYKISILRNPNYHMLFWIWLGLSNSIIKTIRYERPAKNESGLPLPLDKKEGVSS